jgi:processing peptidase subunit alpha
MRSTCQLTLRARRAAPSAGFATNPLASLFGNGPAEEGVSLTTPFPGVTVSSSSPAKTTSNITKLANGVRVISENTPGHCTSMGVFVGAGSRDETENTVGAAKMLECMAYKTSEGRSQFGLHHEVEAMGGVLSVQASREDIVYGADVLSENTGPLLEVMAESIMNPQFMEHEITDEHDAIKARCATAMDNSNQVVTEAAHTAAFGASGLGRSIAPSFAKLKALDSAALHEFHAKGFTAGNIVVAAAGVDHADFVKQVESAFGGLATAPAPAKAASPYTGGQYCLAGEPSDGMTHVVLGFNGASWKSDNLIPMCVLNTLMGGGGSFSAGGPGKGMYSRLYLQVLNQHHWVQNATALNSPYTDSGLFGIFGSSMGGDAPALVQVLAEQLAGMAGPVSAEELARAKAMTKSSVHMNLESRAIVLEDLGKQVLCYGKRLTAADICAQIDALTAADLQKAAKELISTPLTYSAWGETHSLPRYDTVANAIN